jgi:hypothetical protein
VEEHAVVLGAPHRGHQVHHRRQHSCLPCRTQHVRTSGDLRHSSCVWVHIWVQQVGKL